MTFAPPAASRSAWATTSGFTSIMATLAPAFRYSSAIASPMLRAAPVTTQVLPASSAPFVLIAASLFPGITFAMTFVNGLLACSFAGAGRARSRPRS